MDGIDLRDLFSELRQVKVLVSQEGSVKLSLSGSVILTRKPYLELTLPREAWPVWQTLDPRSQILLCLETEESVFLITTTIAMVPGEGRLLLQAEDYVQERQKRSAARVPAEQTDILYWHLDEEGGWIGEAKEAQALDISSTGLRMRLGQVVQPCQALGVKLVIHKAPRATILCTAQIVRMALKADSSIEVAAHFEDIDPQDRQRITDFCREENVVSEDP